jgi:anti-sigma factor RsiW
MNCESYDWKAYALGELDRPARTEAESHAATCASCRNELATLRLTLDTLSTLHEEEMPRRIAFVSDKVFEPRWWQRVFSPNFAAACVIAGAILVHAFARPGIDDAKVQAQMKAQIDVAVSKAVAEQTESIVARDNERYSQAYAIATGLERQ